jgi:hypothetical protein
MLSTDMRAATGRYFTRARRTILERHPAPRRQYLVTLSGPGRLKPVTASAYSKPATSRRRRYHRRTTPRVLGNDRVFMTVPLADEKKKVPVVPVV